MSRVLVWASATLLSVGVLSVSAEETSERAESAALPELPAPAHAPRDQEFDGARLRAATLPGLHRGDEGGPELRHLAAPPTRTQTFDHLYRDGGAGSQSERSTTLDEENSAPNLFDFRF